MTCDEENQSEPWKNDVARQLNVISGRVEYMIGMHMDETDKEFVAADQSIVERVAHFEEIKECA